jgi:hypothetical protein
MKINEWKDKVLQSLNQEGGSTFAKVTKMMGEEGEGCTEILFPGCSNLVLWCGMRRELAISITKLYDERSISYCPCKDELYRNDGLFLSMPIAYAPTDYAFSHWCPVLIRTHMGRQPHSSGRRQDEEY